MAKTEARQGDGVGVPSEGEPGKEVLSFMAVSHLGSSSGSLSSFRPITGFTTPDRPWTLPKYTQPSGRMDRAVKAPEYRTHMAWHPLLSLTREPPA